MVPFPIKFYIMASAHGNQTKMAHAEGMESPQPRGHLSFSESLVENSWVKVNPTESFKVIILGDSEVGKTTLAHLYTKGEALTKSTTTIGFDPFEKTVTVNRRKARLTLWDTAGQERSRGGLVPLFYRDADAAVFVYDITNWRSFENISQWLQEMGSYCDLSQSVLVLVGNKRDQEEDRKVDRGTAERLSVSRHMLYREVSSHSINHLQEVNELFGEIAERLIAAKDRNVAFRSIRENRGIHLEDSDGWIIINDTNSPHYVTPPRGQPKCTRC